MYWAFIQLQCKPSWRGAQDLWTNLPFLQIIIVRPICECAAQWTHCHALSIPKYHLHKSYKLKHFCMVIFQLLIGPLRYTIHPTRNLIEIRSLFLVLKYADQPKGPTKLSTFHEVFPGLRSLSNLNSWSSSNAYACTYRQTDRQTYLPHKRMRTILFQV
jgi:hypothetical protein